jgi:hypothetical protein
VAFRLLTGVPSWIRRAIKSPFGAVLTDDSESVPSSACAGDGTPTRRRYIDGVDVLAARRRGGAKRSEMLAGLANWV